MKHLALALLLLVANVATAKTADSKVTNAPASPPAVPTGLGPRTFIHPGIPLTKRDLDEVKRNIAPSHGNPRSRRSRATAHLSLAVKWPVRSTPFAGRPIRTSAWKGDMDAVYKLSLLWYLTGNEAYAKKSHDVLMAYVKGQKSFGGAEMYLSLGDYADIVLGGADILRRRLAGLDAGGHCPLQSLFPEPVRAQTGHPTLYALQTRARCN